MVKHSCQLLHLCEATNQSMILTTLVIIGESTYTVYTTIRENWSPRPVNTEYAGIDPH
jgi:hypothetical protein